MFDDDRQHFARGRTRVLGVSREGVGQQARHRPQCATEVSDLPSGAVARPTALDPEYAPVPAAASLATSYSGLGFVGAGSRRLCQNARMPTAAAAGLCGIIPRGASFVMSRRADAECDAKGARHGCRLLKIAMLRPTSALPRATDAGGDIAVGTTKVQTSLDAYLGSAERVAVLADRVWKVCVALVVALVVAWALGVLHGAVRLL